MSELFFTDPETSPTVSKRENISFSHRDRTVVELVGMGVPQQIAELAMIDFRHILHVCQTRKLVPFQTARFMFADVFNLYTRKDKTWHFSPCS